MATKLEIKGNFLFITEGSDLPERFISRITSYDFNSTQTELLIRQPEGSNQVTFKYSVSDLVDSEDNPFSGLEDIETFLNENLGGFSTASGGSEAVETEPINTDTTLSKSVNYAVDTSQNEVNINIPSNVDYPFIVSDAGDSFRSNSCFVNILNANGVTVDFSVELSRRNRSYWFYFDGSSWNYREEGRGEFIPIGASFAIHNDEIDFLDNSITREIQGYYGLLSGFYFGGSATETIIDVNEVNTWIDVELDVNGAGLFDNRPQSMVDAQAIGHEGDGSDGNPIVFKLEGLNTRAFCNFRASLAFEPDEDEGQLESRLLFNRHSGASPSIDFPIEEVSLSMQNGADKDYVSEPMLSFFVGDTIDTNGVGDAGKCRFQIKSNVAGTLKLRALTWYINK